MSSPAGLPAPRSDFLARWMPCSSRAGVILSASPDVAGSLRSSYSSVAQADAREPNDSFCSQFAPLPVSPSSSCLNVHTALGNVTAPGKPTWSPGEADCANSPDDLSAEMDSVEGMVRQTQDLPLMLRLEQLKQWQQHMQDQLKAHQLEQLLRLQDEQQRLLGMVPTGADYPECSGLPGAGWHGEILQGGSVVPHGETQWSSPQPPGHTHSGRPNPAQAPETLLHHQGIQEDERTLGASVWSCEHSAEQLSTGDDEDDDGEEETIAEHGTEHREECSIELQDRPIRPGVGGRSQTFEEMLEEQLKLEEQKLMGKPDTEGLRTKRTFLRRGEGLSRFTRGKATERDPKTRLDPKSCRGSEPSRTSQRAVSGTRRTSQRPPVQRKTAVLSKENRPPNSTTSPPETKVAASLPRAAAAAVVRPRVLGSHQKPNVGSDAAWLRPKTHPPSRPPASRAGAQGNPVAMAAEQDGGRGAKTPVCPRAEGAGAATAELQESFALRREHWDRDRQRECAELGEFELLEQAADELSFSSNSSFIARLLHRDLHAKGGSQPRRLSSTPIKQTPHPDPKAHIHPDRNTHTHPNLHIHPQPVSQPHAEAEAGRVCVGVRQEAEEEEEEEERPAEESTDASFSSSSSELPISHCFPVYDKRSYQDRDSCLGQEGEGSFSNHNDLTLVEVKGQMDFDDDDTWNEAEETTTDTAGNDRDTHTPALTHTHTQPEMTLKRKVAVAKGVEHEGSLRSQLDREPETTPTSQLVAKLFPALKPKPRLPEPEPEPEPTCSKQGAAQSRLLRERLVELEMEIERFRTENASLSRLRQENESTQESLRKERAEFEQKRAEDVSRWEEFKREENRKLQRDRKLFEKHAAAARVVPDNREIQALKQQVAGLQEDQRRRETRWSSTQTRLRQQLDALSAENSTLRNQLRTLETLRLSAWKNTEKETKEKERGRSRLSDSSGGACSRRPKSRSPSGTVRTNPPQGSSRGSPEAYIPPEPAGNSSGSHRKSSSLPAPGQSSVELMASGGWGHDFALSKDSIRNLSPTVGVPRATIGQEEIQQEEVSHPDGKVERVLPDGGRLVVFPNGTQKELSADGQTAKVTFFNGDVKQVMADQRVIYYYSDAQTTHTTYPDGIEVLQFPNGQTEKHFPDGHKEITFPDQTVKNLYPDGREESVLTDGTIILQNPDGSKEIQFNTGQRELHTAEFKRREYPDGTVKTVYSDGRQETHYPTGRLRRKDSHGRVVMDAMA